MGERSQRRAAARAAGVPFEPHYHAGPKVRLLRTLHANLSVETAHDVQAEFEEYRKLGADLQWDVFIDALLTSAVTRARAEREAARIPQPKKVQVEPYTPERAEEIAAAQAAVRAARGEG